MLYTYLHNTTKSSTKKVFNLLAQVLIFSLCVVLPAQALFVSPPKDPMPLIKEIFPTHTSISEKSIIKDKKTKDATVDEESLLVWTIHQEEEILGYAFETNDIVKIPAYSGEPVNMLVAIDTKGVLFRRKSIRASRTDSFIGYSRK